jgi:membrane protease YdiL (CAAX protease family)
MDPNATNPVPPADLSAAPPTPPKSPIFWGPDGLRAGWSILLFIAILAALMVPLQLIMHAVMVHRHMPPPTKTGELHPALFVMSEGALVLFILIATALMGKVEGHRLTFYGLTGADRLRQFVIGLLSGFAFLSLLVEILRATHHMTLAPAGLAAGMALKYALAWALCFMLVALAEELLLRGYLLFTLARGLRFWPAAILLALTFGGIHRGNPGESPIGLLSAALIALVFSLSLWRLGHLWWAIGFHASWDWSQSYLYGTPDSGLVSTGRLMTAHPSGSILLSGGATGPEGSAWILLIIALAALFVWRTQPNRGIRLAKESDRHSSSI